MSNRVLQGLAGLLLPLGLYGAAPQSSYTNYSRSTYRIASSQQHVASSVAYSASAAPLTRLEAEQTPAKLMTSQEELTLSRPAAELLIIDGAIPDKHLLLQGLRPGVQVAVIEQGADGLAQLESILASYSDLSALHLVSHGADGVLQLGETAVSQESLAERVSTLAALDGALKDGADLLLYGCDLAATSEGDDLLELIAGGANVDVAASDDLTGASELGGDWDLEVIVGEVQTNKPFSKLAMADFSDVLQTTVETKFLGTPTGGYESTSGYYAGLNTSPLQVSETFKSNAGNSYIYWNAPDTSPDMIFKADGANACKFTVSEINAYSLQSDEITLTSASYVEFTLDGGATEKRSFAAGTDSLKLPTSGSDNLLTKLVTPTAVVDVTSFKVKLAFTGSATNPTPAVIQDVAFLSVKLDSTTAAGCGGGGAGVNTVPTINVDNSNLAYTANSLETRIDSAATLTDADGDADWNGGTLKIEITNNAEASDELSIPDNKVGNINTAGTNLLNGATVIGTLSSSEGTVTNNTALTVTFNASATDALVQQTLRAVSFRSTSATPSILDRTVTFTATDKNAGSSVGTRTITVSAAAPANSPPTNITISANSLLVSQTGIGAKVGDLGFEDPDGVTATYSLVAAGTAPNGGCSSPAGNGSFQIAVDPGDGVTPVYQLKTTSSLSPATYAVCVQVDDSVNTFEKTLTINVAADPAPALTPEEIKEVQEQQCEAQGKALGVDGNCVTVAAPTIESVIVLPDTYFYGDKVTVTIITEQKADTQPPESLTVSGNVGSHPILTGSRTGENSFTAEFSVIDTVLSYFGGIRPSYLIELRDSNNQVVSSLVKQFEQDDIIIYSKNCTGTEVLNKGTGACVPQEIKFTSTNLGSLSENGSTGSFKVSLAHETKPESPLTIKFKTDGSEKQFDFNPEFVLLDGTATSQEITVTAIDDKIDEGSAKTHEIAAFAELDGEKIEVTAEATVTDNDSAGISMEPAFVANGDQGRQDQNLELKEGDVEGAKYKIALNSKPTSPVTIHFKQSGEFGSGLTETSTDSDTTLDEKLDEQLEFTPAFVKFTPGNWNVEQSVSIIAVDDQKFGPEEMLVTFSGTIDAQDERYKSLDFPSIQFSVLDGSKLKITSVDIKDADIYFIEDDIQLEIELFGHKDQINNIELNGFLGMSRLSIENPIDLSEVETRSDGVTVFQVDAVISYFEPDTQASTDGNIIANYFSPDVLPEGSTAVNLPVTLTYKGSGSEESEKFVGEIASRVGLSLVSSEPQFLEFTEVRVSSSIDNSIAQPQAIDSGSFGTQTNVPLVEGSEATLELSFGYSGIDDEFYESWPYSISNYDFGISELKGSEEIEIVSIMLGDKIFTEPEKIVIPGNSTDKLIVKLLVIDDKVFEVPFDVESDPYEVVGLQPTQGLVDYSDEIRRPITSEQVLELPIADQAESVAEKNPIAFDFKVPNSGVVLGGTRVDVEMSGIFFGSNDLDYPVTFDDSANVWFELRASDNENSPRSTGINFKVTLPKGASTVTDSVIIPNIAPGDYTLNIQSLEIGVNKFLPGASPTPYMGKISNVASTPIRVLGREPIIEAVSIPDKPYKIGDSVTAQIKVDPFTFQGGSIDGRIAGLPVVGLVPVGDDGIERGNYTTSFDIPENRCNLLNGGNLSTKFSSESVFTFDSYPGSDLVRTRLAAGIRLYPEKFRSDRNSFCALLSKGPQDENPIELLFSRSKTDRFVFRAFFKEPTIVDSETSYRVAFEESVEAFITLLPSRSMTLLYCDDATCSNLQSLKVDTISEDVAASESVSVDLELLQEIGNEVVRGESYSTPVIQANDPIYMTAPTIELQWLQEDSQNALVEPVTELKEGQPIRFQLVSSHPLWTEAGGGWPEPISLKVEVESERAVSLGELSSTDPQVGESNNSVQLTIPSGGLNSQSIAITAINNDIDESSDGLVTLTITEIGSVLNSDAAVLVKELALIDDDAVGFAIEQILGEDEEPADFEQGIELEEGSPGIKFGIHLETEPASDVTITFSEGSPSQLEIKPETLTFSADNWKIAKELSIAAEDDDSLEEKSIGAELVVAIKSEDYSYNGLRFGPIPFSVIDNESRIPVIKAVGIPKGIYLPGSTMPLEVTLSAGVGGQAPTGSLVGTIAGFKIEKSLSQGSEPSEDSFTYTVELELPEGAGDKKNYFDPTVLAGSEQALPIPVSLTFTNSNELASEPYTEALKAKSGVSLIQDLPKSIAVNEVKIKTFYRVLGPDGDNVNGEGDLVFTATPSPASSSATLLEETAKASIEISFNMAMTYSDKPLDSWPYEISNIRVGRFDLEKDPFKVIGVESSDDGYIKVDDAGDNLLQIGLRPNQSSVEFEMSIKPNDVFELPPRKLRFDVMGTPGLSFPNTASTTIGAGSEEVVLTLASRTPKEAPAYPIAFDLSVENEGVVVVGKPIKVTLTSKYAGDHGRTDAPIYSQAIDVNLLVKNSKNEEVDLGTSGLKLVLDAGERTAELEEPIVVPTNLPVGEYTVEVKSVRFGAEGAEVKVGESPNPYIGKLAAGSTPVITVKGKKPVVRRISIPNKSHILGEEVAIEIEMLSGSFLKGNVAGKVGGFPVDSAMVQASEDNPNLFTATFTVPSNKNNEDLTFTVDSDLLTDDPMSLSLKITDAERGIFYLKPDGSFSKDKPQVFSAISLKTENSMSLGEIKWPEGFLVGEEVTLDLEIKNSAGGSVTVAEISNNSFTIPYLDIQASASIPVSLTVTSTEKEASDIYASPIEQDADALLPTPAIISLSAKNKDIDSENDGFQIAEKGSLDISVLAKDAFGNSWPRSLTIPLSYEGSETNAEDFVSALPSSVTLKERSEGLISTTIAEDEVPETGVSPLGELLKVAIDGSKLPNTAQASSDAFEVTVVTPLILTLTLNQPIIRDDPLVYSRSDTWENFTQVNIGTISSNRPSGTKFEFFHFSTLCETRNSELLLDQFGLDGLQLDVVIPGFLDPGTVDLCIGSEERSEYATVTLEILPEPYTRGSGDRSTGIETFSSSMFLNEKPIVYDSEDILESWEVVDASESSRDLCLPQLFSPPTLNIENNDETKQGTLILSDDTQGFRGYGHYCLQGSSKVMNGGVLKYETTITITYLADLTSEEIEEFESTPGVDDLQIRRKDEGTVFEVSSLIIAIEDVGGFFCRPQGRIVDAPENRAPGISLNADNALELVSSQNRLLTCIPEADDIEYIKEELALLSTSKLAVSKNLVFSVDASTLKNKMESNDASKASLKSSAVETDDEAIIRFTPSFSSIVAAKDQELGLVGFWSSSSGNLDMLQLTYENGVGERRLRSLLPVVLQWSDLQSSILAFQGAEWVSRGLDGTVTVHMGEEAIHLLPAYEFRREDSLEAANDDSNVINFELVEDVNGDGLSDLEVKYPDGQSQYFYLLP